MNHPKIVWSAVNGHCLTYEIYRSFNLVNWLLQETTTGTSWIDHEINMGGFSNPVHYKVRAINNIPLEGYYSNIRTAYAIYQSKITENTDAVPNYYKLSSNFPNPFNPITNIRYDLPEESIVLLKIYDIRGREIKTLVNGIENAGFKNVIWDSKDKNGRPVSSGMYFYELDAFSQESDKVHHETRKMVLLR